MDNETFESVAGSDNATLDVEQKTIKQREAKLSQVAGQLGRSKLELQQWFDGVDAPTRERFLSEADPQKALEILATFFNDHKAEIN